MDRAILNLPFDNKNFIVYGSELDRSIFQYVKASKGEYEYYIMNLLKTIIDPKSICLDIGANIGLISLALSYLANNGKVYSFEPSQKNYSYLVRNIKVNKIDNILPFNLGIYNENANMRFCDISDGGGWSFVYNNRESIATPNQDIMCVKLDDWIKAENVTKIDFIKIDTEGSELKALFGALNTIQLWKPDIIIEFNPICISRNTGDNPEDVFNLLKSIYPSVYFINRDSNLIKVEDYSALLKLIEKFVYGDLYCTFK
ncbi:FkbM family methyltransferase [Bacillus sp. TL12]|uniref:FkbM family methyltransferase n=1 Tax=Bacillus sp. TL12 TaxID=2894756 RepID=UPI001F5227B1|nr:FkbM family methyltransferase [Bacillus sp. TL12]MCI0764731.1 FkbM family methyltransferase [Bacillus sp. TL12]